MFLRLRSQFVAGLAGPLFALGVVVFPAPAKATVTLFETGLSSVGNPVSFRADLTISGNNLTLVLSNTSPAGSLAPNDTLGSFFWDIIGPGNTRPTLTLSSAKGSV